MREVLPAAEWKLRRLPAAALLAAWSLAGCAVGPHYTGPPPAPNLNSFKGAKAENAWKSARPADRDPRGPWWEVFHDPDLNRLETAAAADNQDLRVSIARIEQTRAQARVAAADFFPNAAFDGQYMRQRLSNTEPIQKAQLIGSDPLAGSGSSSGSSSSGGGSAPLILNDQPLTRTYNLFRVPADLNWELDVFGRVRRNYEAARAERAESEADARNVMLSVTANVAATYFDLHAIDSEIGVLQRTIKSRGDALGIAEERLQAGLSGEEDVQRQRAELASNQADLAGVQRSRAEMENALATLVGQPATSFRVPTRSLSDTTPPHIPPGLPSQLLERRADVAEAERALAAANAQIGVAVAAFFPVIRLTGAAGFESADAGLVFDWPSRFWQIGPSVSLPIFEGGRNTANLRLARGRYDEGVARYRQQVLVAFQDVENALADLRTLAVQAKAQEEAVVAARRTLQLSQNQFQKGAVTLLDVVDAERTLLAYERTAVELQGQRLQATVQLIKALGGGWS